MRSLISSTTSEEEEEAEVLALVITDPIDDSLPKSYTLSSQAVEAVASVCFLFELIMAF